MIKSDIHGLENALKLVELEAGGPGSGRRPTGVHEAILHHTRAAKFHEKRAAKAEKRKDFPAASVHQRAAREHSKAARLYSAGLNESARLAGQTAERLSTNVGRYDKKPNWFTRTALMYAKFV